MVIILSIHLTYAEILSDPIKIGTQFYVYDSSHLSKISINYKLNVISTGFCITDDAISCNRMTPTF